MFIALEVSAPDAPRSVDLADLRSQIADALADLIPDALYGLTVEVETPSGRIIDVEVEAGPINILSDADASVIGFVPTPSEV